MLRSQEQSFSVDDERPNNHRQFEHIQMAPQQYFMQEKDVQGIDSNIANQTCQNQQPIPIIRGYGSRDGVSFCDADRNQSRQQFQQQQQQQQQQSSQPNQFQSIIEAEGPETARMLVVLQSGEQRLITFTLPKDSCTVQQLLDQVGVPYGPHTNIECITNPDVDVDYLVKIGVTCSSSPRDIASAAKNTLQHLQQYRTPSFTVPEIIDTRPQVKRKSAELVAESLSTKPGPVSLAVCPNCGLCGDDHQRCIRCRVVFDENVRLIASAGQSRTKKPKTIPSLIATEKRKKEISVAEKKNASAGRGRGNCAITGHPLSMPNSSVKLNFNNPPLPLPTNVDPQLTGSSFQQPTTYRYENDSLSTDQRVGFGLNNSSSMYPQSRQTYDSGSSHRQPKSLHQTTTTCHNDFNIASSSASHYTPTNIFKYPTVSTWMRNRQEYDSIWSPEGTTGLSGEMNPRQIKAPGNNLGNIWESADYEDKEKNETMNKMVESTGNVCAETDLSCVVCQDVRKNILIWPCRHICVCEKCSKKIEICPLCRKHVEQLIPVFI